MISKYVEWKIAIKSLKKSPSIKWFLNRLILLWWFWKKYNRTTKHILIHIHTMTMAQVCRVITELYDSKPRSCRELDKLSTNYSCLSKSKEISYYSSQSIVFSSTSKPVVEISILVKPDKFDGKLYLSVPWNSMNCKAVIMKMRYLLACFAVDIRAIPIDTTSNRIISELSPFVPVFNAYENSSLWSCFLMSFFWIKNCSLRNSLDLYLKTLATSLSLTSLINWSRFIFLEIISSSKI